MTYRIRYFIITIAAGLLIIISNSCNNSGTPVEEEQVVITPVTVTNILYKPLEESIELPAVTSFLSRNIVRSGTTGFLEKINVTLGDYITKNQLLFILKTREASVISDNLKADSTFAFGGEIKIYAPQEGVISSIAHNTGDFIQEGDELAVISDKSSLVFIVDIPFELNNVIEKNLTCRVNLPDGRTLTGYIYGRLPEMDTQSQTIRYMMKSEGAANLPSNLNVLVRFVKKNVERAAVLPKVAVLGNETQTEFWVMKLINDTIAVKVRVKKGIELNDEIEITDPMLLPTDRIVVTGGYGLPDTARVAVKQ